MGFDEKLLTLGFSTQQPRGRAPQHNNNIRLSDFIIIIIITTAVTKAAFTIPTFARQSMPTSWSLASSDMLMPRFTIS